MQIAWTARAISDLQNIRAYICQHNPYAASTVAGRIVNAVKALSDFPYSGKPGRIFGTRELVITRTTYSAAFRVLEDRIEILRVLHQAQDWEKAMPEIAN